MEHDDIKEIEDSSDNSTLHYWSLDSPSPCASHLFNELSVTTVALGESHGILLTANNSVYSIGSNKFGQLGLGDYYDRESPTFIPQLPSFVNAIASGHRHSAAVCDNGELFTWGDSRQAQCGRPAKGTYTEPEIVTFKAREESFNSVSSTQTANRYQTKIRKVACGGLHTLALDHRGNVWSWGTGPGLGHGDDIDEITSPCLIPSLQHRRVVVIACGSNHSLAITQDDHNVIEIRQRSYSSQIQSDRFSASVRKVKKKTEKIPFQHSVFYDFRDSQGSDLSSTKSAVEAGVETIEDETISKPDNDSSQTITERDSQSQDTMEYGLMPDAISLSTSTSLEALGNIETSDSGQNDSDVSLLNPKLSSSREILSSNEDIFHSALDLRTSKDRADDEELSDTFNGLTTDTYGSTWSVMSVLNTSEVERIGCNVPVSGSTLVWAWGQNSMGQLGTGDLKNRSMPICVKELANRGVTSIAAGTNHSLAITSFAEVFSWGDNTKGQCAQSKSIIAYPHLIKALCDVLVWSATAGGDFSLFIATTNTDTTEMYFSGDSNKSNNKDLSVPVVAGVAGSKQNERRWRRLSQRPKRNSDGTIPQSNVDIEIRRIVHFKQEDQLCNVFASHRQFVCISSRDEFIDSISNFSSSERKYFCNLSFIKSVIVQPMVTSEFWLSAIDRPGGDGLIPLMDSLSDLLGSIATGVAQLTDIILHGYPLKDLFSFILADSFRAVYERYSKCYCDVVAVGLMQICSKHSINLVSKCRNSLKRLAVIYELEYLDLASFLRIPLRRALFYCDAVRHLIPFAKGEVERDQLYEVISRWQSHTNENSKRMKDALITKAFWEESPAKFTEALKDPQRRVVKTSKADPLSLARASRLSSHSYILFNDVFVHLQFNRNFQVFPLVTMWAEPIEDGESLHNAFKLTSPEQSFVVIAGTPSGKVEWLRTINTAVAVCLSASSSVGLNSSLVNSESGVLKAAIAREAEYTFLNHARFKGATYSGMWLSGLPHGRGKITWPDDISYEGEFLSGNFHGCGTHSSPYTSADSTQSTQVYYGDWFEGKREGYGSMTYGKESEYIGHWRSDSRNGHGTLKSFDGQSSLRTVYIGNWANDHMCGYGVLDSIIRGEKYLGSWVNDLRHGYGIVVTVDGVYYEGKFIQNRLVGRGLLLSDDDTCYQGEFTADMMLSGKGLLTLPNGDYIDGIFNGRWGDGIKVNGVFSKFPNQLLHPSDEQPTTQDLTNFTIPASSKWKSLFDECREQLGYHGHLSPQVSTVWESINESVEKERSQSQATNSSFTSNFYKGPIRQPSAVTNDLKSIQDYLAQAFGTPGHPFNRLLESLIDVYRGTYVGVGAHRRLLPHAVDEARSYVARLYSIIRLVFPDLPDEEFVMLPSDGTLVEDCHEMMNSRNLLHPILLPSIYPPLFTLYALHTEKLDVIYIDRLGLLNKRKDKALLSFLGVNRKFWLCKSETDSNDEDECSPETPYASAVDQLGFISTIYSPMEKVDAIRDSFKCIHEEVDRFWDGKHKLLSMDDLFPVFQFVVVRARIPHLGSEIQFIEDLIDPSVEVGELGHMITTLKACYYQIQNERDKD